MWIVLGMVFGVIVGTTPGIGTGLGMAILIPFTVPLNGPEAIVILISLYCGSIYGSSISAILINTPGGASSAATCFDGYPMSRKGEARDALSISAVSSSFGGSIPVIALFFISPILISVVLLFGTPEYFLITLVGIMMIAVVAQGSLLKGFLSGSFGLLLTTIGIAPMIPQTRYTFDYPWLFDGLHLIAVLIGLFAIAEMLKLSNESGGIAQKGVNMGGSIKDGVYMVLKHPIDTIKFASVGSIIGAIPGAGSSIAAFVSYAEAQRTDPDPTSFGSGNPRGVLASEAANNGNISGSIIPTISFGIPGSSATAVLLGGMLMHGIHPGPDLFTTDLWLTYVMLFTMLIANAFIFVGGLLLITRATYLTKIDSDYIIPIVIVLAVCGGFALRSNWLDPATVILLGFFGFYLKRYDYSEVAFVLGVVLGPLAETNLFRSLEISQGSFLIFVQRPLSIFLLILAIFMLLSPVIMNLKRSGEVNK